MASSKQTSDLADSTFPALEMSERVVLLIDVSRSMSQSDYPPRRLDAAKQAAMAFIDKKLGIDDSDEVAVIAFAGAARAVQGLERVGGNRESARRKIAGLRIAYSGTRISKGLERAEAMLRVRPSGAAGSQKGGPKKGEGSFVPRVVLLSDGENLGGDDPVRTADRLKKSGVFIDTIGIGERGKGSRPGFGLDEDVLQAIASPGRYRYIRDSASLLFHFEGLAEKVVGDSLDGFKPMADGGIKAAADLLRVLGEPAMLRTSPWRPFRHWAAAWAAGLISAAIVGGTLMPAVAPLWGPAIWLLSASSGLLVAWSARLGLRWFRGAVGSVPAVASAAAVSAAIAVGLNALIAGDGDLARAPLQDGLALALALAGAVAGLLLRPAHVGAGVGRMAARLRRAVLGRRGVMRLSADSSYVGELCPNEKNNDTRLTEGDAVVLCPVCGRPHHADCWEWNGGHCFGGDTPCPGKLPIRARV